MANAKDGRPWGVVVASLLAAGSAAAIMALAVLSWVSGHGLFGGGVAVMLCIYAAGLLWAAWGLWRMSVFARGPIVATALLHLAVLSGYLTGSLAWVTYLLAVAPVLTLVAVLWPSTARALRAQRAAARMDVDADPHDTEQPAV